jgi:hypothetical protein
VAIGDGIAKIVCPYFGLDSNVLFCSTGDFIAKGSP